MISWSACSLLFAEGFGLADHGTEHAANILVGDHKLTMPTRCNITTFFFLYPTNVGVLPVHHLHHSICLQNGPDIYVFAMLQQYFLLRSVKIAGSDRLSYKALLLETPVSAQKFAVAVQKQPDTPLIPENWKSFLPSNPQTSVFRLPSSALRLLFSVLRLLTPGHRQLPSRQLQGHPHDFFNLRERYGAIRTFTYSIEKRLDLGNLPLVLSPQLHGLKIFL